MTSLTKKQLHPPLCTAMENSQSNLPSTIVYMDQRQQLVSNSDILNQKKTQFRMVKKRVKRIIDELKRGQKLKWTDPDFGPSENDEYAASSLYRSGKPPGAVGNSSYPNPEKLRWDRPVYNMTPNKKKVEQQEEEEEDDSDEGGWDDEFNDTSYEDSSSWCSKAELFKDGMSAGDVKQGKLGDCWFLGAMATLAVKPDMVRKVFWPKSDVKLNELRNYGIFVCRFMKDFVWYYVIVDDLIPVYDTQSGKVFFSLEFAIEFATHYV